MQTVKSEGRAHRKRMRGFAVGAISCAIQVIALPAWCSDIVATGATNTQVTTGASGVTVIVPAPVKFDVSYNAFSRFDVNAAGAQFQNTDIKARTIVAEVFSPLPSRIEGPVSVDGPRANLIVANQNGLRVNGGSFVNFGSVALTTGAVTLRDETLSQGATQRFVDIATSQGDIQIEAKGLDANLIHLELIAKQVGITGPITNAYSSATAVTRVVAGSTTATFDTMASPTDNLTPWVYYAAAKDAPTAPVAAIAVDVSAASTVTSGRIEILVTDKGAGVRNAGHLTATAGDIVISASGALEQTGGEIQALGNVRVKAQSLTQSSRDGSSSLVAAGGALRVEVDQDIVNVGGTLRGTVRSSDDTDNPYAVSLKAGGKIVNQTLPGGPGAIIFGSADDVLLTAPAGLSVLNTRVISNGSLTVVTDGVVRVESVKQQGIGATNWSTSSLLSSQGGTSLDLGTLVDPDHQAYMVSSGGLTVKAGDVQNIGGHIYSNNAAVSIEAQRTITTQGLQTGAMRYESVCFLFLCRRSAASSEALVGGQIQAGGTLTLKAGQSIINDGGSVFSVGDMSIDAPLTIGRGSPLHTVITRASGLKALFGDTWAGVYAADQGGSFTAQQGRLILSAAARQEGGVFAAGGGIDGAITVIHPPQRDPVTLDDHIGILSW